MRATEMTYSDFLKKVPVSGRLFYSVMEGFPQGVLITDNVDRIVYANLKMAHLTGYSRKELIGKTAHLFLYFPEQHARLKELVEQRASGIFESYEVYVKRKAGAPFLSHTVTSPYKSDEEEISGTISIVTEVAVSKREDELRAIAVAATKTHNSIMILDRLGKIEWVNEGFTHLSGYELYEVIDTRGEILYGDNGAEFLKQINEVLKTRKPISCESRNLNKQGFPYWVVRSITPNFDPRGTIQEIVVIDTDITSQKKLEDVKPLNL